MITETKEIYKCEYCKKLYQKKHFAKTHEKMCSKNPDNDRACFDCVHMTKKDVEIYRQYNDEGGEFKEKLKLCYCPKIESFLHPPKVEHKNNKFELVDKSNQPMPRKCKYQQTYLIHDWPHL